MLIYSGNPWKQNLTSGYNCVERERFKSTPIFKVGTHFMPTETSRKKRKRNWKENFKFGWHLSGSVQYFTNPEFQPSLNRVRVWDIMSMTCTDRARDGNMTAFWSECRIVTTLLPLKLSSQIVPWHNITLTLEYWSIWGCGLQCTPRWPIISRI